MTNKPTKPKLQPTRIEHSEESLLREFRIHVANESQHWIMVLLFFAAAFIIYYLLQITLITLLEASKILIGFGLISFMAIFLIRNRFELGLLDGLYYSAFSSAPICLALFLSINAACQDTYKETHLIVGFEAGGSGYTYQLKDEAYQEFWRIRNMSTSPHNLPIPRVQFTFCDGIFGYKVVKDVELR